MAHWGRETFFGLNACKKPRLNNGLQASYNFTGPCALCHSRRMKALKSTLAKQLLAHPDSKALLRSFLIGKPAGAGARSIIIQVPGKPEEKVSPKLVAKAS